MLLDRKILNQGEHDMNSSELKQWIKENNIRQRTIESFWRCFANYKTDNPNQYAEYFSDFDKDSLVLWMNKIVLKIMNWDNFEEEGNHNDEYVEAYLSIEYKNEDIGYYSLLFNFSGESFDDYFVLR